MKERASGGKKHTAQWGQKERCASRLGKGKWARQCGVGGGIEGVPVEDGISLSGDGAGVGLAGEVVLWRMV